VLRKTTCSLIVLSLAALLILAGCGAKNAASPETQRSQLELEEVWGMFKLHLDEKKRPPANLEELKSYEPGFVLGFKGLQSGQYVMRWDIAKNGSEEAVLVYPKNAPTQGGTILQRNGTIKEMTAQQVADALKSS
jgi:hypothetical protein